MNQARQIVRDGQRSSKYSSVSSTTIERRGIRLGVAVGAGVRARVCACASQRRRRGAATKLRRSTIEWCGDWALLRSPATSRPSRPGRRGGRSSVRLRPAEWVGSHSHPRLGLFGPLLATVIAVRPTTAATTVHCPLPNCFLISHSHGRVGAS